MGTFGIQSKQEAAVRVIGCHWVRISSWASRLIKRRLVSRLPGLLNTYSCRERDEPLSEPVRGKHKRLRGFEGYPKPIHRQRGV